MRSVFLVQDGSVAMDILRSCDTQYVNVWAGRKGGGTQMPFLWFFLCFFDTDKIFIFACFCGFLCVFFFAPGAFWILLEKCLPMKNSSFWP